MEAGSVPVTVVRGLKRVIDNAELAARQARRRLAKPGMEGLVDTFIIPAIGTRPSGPARFQKSLNRPVIHTKRGEQETKEKAQWISRLIDVLEAGKGPVWQEAQGGLCPE
eukprot:10866325-Heterocapsa_arctica.AAC.1